MQPKTGGFEVGAEVKGDGVVGDGVVDLATDPNSWLQTIIIHTHMTESGSDREVFISPALRERRAVDSITDFLLRVYARALLRCLPFLSNDSGMMVPLD